MNHQRIMIIGCGGSGKSTLARQIGKISGLPVVHLDQLFWRKGWVHVSQEEFDHLLSKALEGDRWIVDGNFDRTMQMRLQRCDTVIYLDRSRWVCLYRVCKRVLQNLGKTRPDMGEGCPEKVDLEFLTWIWNFNKEFRNKYCQLLNESSDKETFIVKKRSEYESLLRKFAQEAH